MKSMMKYPLVAIENMIVLPQVEAIDRSQPTYTTNAIIYYQIQPSCLGTDNVGGRALSQLMKTDLDLYKCKVRGKMVMGYEKENHVRDVHRGTPVEWKKMR